MSQNRKKVKFHGLEVENVIVRYSQKESHKPESIRIEEFDAENDTQLCQTVNIQVVSDYVTISFYRNESNNEIIRRELIPSHAVEHIWVNDLNETGNK